MINPKCTGIFSGVGFFLSFLIGLIAGNGFAHSLIVALIFALVFGVLSIGISILYGKFLSDGDSGIDVSKASSNLPNAGSVVNITIDEDNLPDETYSPKFAVGTNRPALRMENPPAKPVVASKAPVAASPTAAKEGSSLSDITGAAEKASVDAKTAEKPSAATTPTGATANVVSDGASFKPMDLSSVTNPQSAQQSTGTSSSVSSDSLETLPDIGDFSPAERTVSTNNEIISDSDFASVGSKSSVQSSNAGSQDAQLMAQAIRTVLAKSN